MKDDKFKRPKAIVNIKIYPKQGLLQELGLTPFGRTLTEVWVACIKEHMREFNYMAQMASLELEFTVSHDALTLTFSGFNDSLAAFISQTFAKIQEFRTLPDDSKRQIFDQVKEKLSQEWHNFYFEQSYRQAAAFFENLVLTPTFEKKALKNVLDSLTYE
jgi:insulysin